MKTVNLTQGYKALVDDEDYPLIENYRWCAHRESTCVYAVRHSSRKFGPQITIQMHRVILGLQDPETGKNLAPRIDVDHRNRTGIDNRRVNIHPVTRQENNLNRSRSGAKTYSSRYRGVSFLRGRWMARIRRQGTLTYLGLFKTEDEAAAAYVTAVNEV